MTPMETLRAEHRDILRVLACLEVATDAIDAGRPVAVADLRSMVRFFREYADGCHHAKEEAHFFPALERHGIPRHGGPVAVMLEEHEEGREAVRGMADALATESPNAAALSDFASHARGFVPLLRGHIGKEDHVLFRMAEDALTPAAIAELEDLFEKVVRLEIGQAAHDELAGIARELGERYGVPEQSNLDNLPSCAGG